jgi:hypothetical protein
MIRKTMPVAAIIILLSAGCGGGDADSKIPVETTPDMSGQYSAVYQGDSSSCTIQGLADNAPAGGSWEFTVTQDDSDISMTIMNGETVLSGVVLEDGAFALSGGKTWQYPSGGMTSTVFVSYVMSGIYEDKGIQSELKEKDIYQDAQRGNYSCESEYQVWAVKD